MNGIAAMLVLLLVGACAGGGDAPTARSADENYRAAHLTCHQRMMAASTIGHGMTPNRHLYLMCMKEKGYDV